MKYWIFDLDGTLTIAKHNFLKIKQELGISSEQDIIKSLDALSEVEKKQKYQQLDQIEKEIALQTELNPGVINFLSNLKENFNSKLAILTRNTKESAIISLEAIALLPFFSEELIIGRDEAEAKPSPDGIKKILNHWLCRPQNVFMVGDYLYDLQAGKNAGTKTILVNPVQNSDWKEYYDYSFQSFDELSSSFFADS